MIWIIVVFNRVNYNCQSTITKLLSVHIPAISSVNKSFLCFFLAVLSVYKSYLPLVYLQSAGFAIKISFTVMNWTVNSRYWVFQIFGWALYALINIFFAELFDQLTSYMLIRLLFF